MYHDTIENPVELVKEPIQKKNSFDEKSLSDDKIQVEEINSSEVRKNKEVKLLISKIVAKEE